MQGTPNSVFQCDFKYLVDADTLRGRKRPGHHAHWVAGSIIAIAVGIWLGGDPAASIGDRESVALDPSTPAAGSLGPISLHRRALFPAPALLPLPEPVEIDPPAADGTAAGGGGQRPSTDGAGPRADPAAPASSADSGAGVVAMRADQGIDDTDPATAPVAIDEPVPNPDLGPAATAAQMSPPALNWWSDDEPWLSDEPIDTLDGGADPATWPLRLELGYQTDLVLPQEPPKSVWRTVDIRSGDTLTTLFKRHGLDPAVAAALSRTEEAAVLNHLGTGPRLRLRPGVDGALEGLEYDLDQTRILSVERDDAGGYRVETVERPIEVRQIEIAGTIRSSLFQAGNDAGLSDQLIYRLASIFKYDIDFSRDLQPDDRFSVIYEEKYVDGEKIGTGPILAARFTISGKDHQAIRHVGEDGTDLYYTPDGESLRTAFLRSPVQFTRISSHFSKRRYHPVLKKWRAHTGVDYAARHGTPVVATADGIVRHVGRKGGYGKTVIIAHGDRYSTLYAHLSDYGKAVGSGKHVRQGQIIGYVGSTGLATGPHLHYEFRVNGAHHDPLAVDLPRSLPIASAERKEFLADARRWTAMLDQVEGR